jgi:Tol biopolymer transport system component
MRWKSAGTGAALAVALLGAGGGANGAVVAANGSIAYQCIAGGGLQTDICVVDPATGAVTNLTSDAADDDSPSWSPDGTKIAFDSFRSTGQPTIQVMNADGTGITRLSATPCCERDFAPVWSPDGTKIAFVSTRDGDGEYEIYVMGADGELVGAPAVRLTDDPATDFGTGIDDWQLTWSPDSQQLAFVSNRDANDPDTCDLYVMNAVDANGDGFGDHLRRLTNDNTYDCDLISPAWSPDGTRIAFTSTRSGDYEIWTVDADGTNPVNVTEFPGMDWGPSWSPDGTMISFTSGRSGSYQIWTVPAPGLAGAPAEITTGGTNRSPDWGGQRQTVPRSAIAEPADGGTYAAKKLTRLHGTAVGIVARISRVQVALRRGLPGGGCAWLTGKAFTAGACDDYRWLKASGTSSWRYKLSRRLAPGGYTLFALARDRAGGEEQQLTTGRNANAFQITP